MIDVKREVEAAGKRIRGHILETPVENSPVLSRMGNCRVFLKLENAQLSGSFKLRGAMNKYLSLSPEEQQGYLVSASSGNHGAAFAYTLDKFGGKGVIYLPETVSPAKLEALNMYRIAIELYGNDGIQSETLAKNTAREQKRIFVSPYNDPQIIGGQGTIGIELFRQIDTIDAVFVPVGGGGLMSGIAGYMKQIDDSISIIGCQPENSKVMYESLQAGKILELESKPTISDGTAGGIEPGAITFDLCKKYVDDFVLVTEDEIINALRLILEKHYLLVEGAAALQVAAFLKTKEQYAGKDVALILSGKRIGLDAVKSVLDKGD